MPDKQEIPIARYDAMHAVVDGDDYKLVRSTTEVNDNGRFVLYTDHLAAISSLAHQLSQEKERNAELLKKLEAPNPHVGKCLECGDALDRPQSIGYCTPCFRVWLKEIDTKPTIED